MWNWRWRCTLPVIGPRCTLKWDAAHGESRCLVHDSTTRSWGYAVPAVVQDCWRQTILGCVLVAYCKNLTCSGIVKNGLPDWSTYSRNRAWVIKQWNPEITCIILLGLGVDRELEIFSAGTDVLGMIRIKFGSRGLVLDQMWSWKI